MRKSRTTAPPVPEPEIFTDEGQYVAIGVGDEKSLFDRVRAKVRGVKSGAARPAVINLSFESPEQLLDVLSPKRYELFKSVRERGSFDSIEELAGVVHRDRSTVSKDLRELAAIGLVIVEKVAHAGHGQRSSVSVAAQDIRVQFTL